MSMTGGVNAGDVERKIAEHLSLAIAGGEDLSVSLLRICYFRAIDDLGLMRLPSDESRIQDMFDALQANMKRRVGGSDAIRRDVFEVIFSK